MVCCNIVYIILLNILCLCISKANIASDLLKPPTAVFNDSNNASVKVVPCTIPTGKFPWNFNNVNMVEIIDHISRISCKNFVLFVELNNLKNITIIGRTLMNIDEAWNSFQMILSAHNFALVQVGNFYKIIDKHISNQSGLRVFANSDKLPFNEEIITYIYKLRHISNNTVKRFINNLISYSGKLHIIDNNLLVITDSVSNIKSILHFLYKIDKIELFNRIHVISLMYSDVIDIKNKLQEIFEPPLGLVSSYSSIVYSKLNRDLFFQSFKFEKIIADIRTNQLLIIASDYDFIKIKEIVMMLDISSLDGGSYGKIHIYMLKNNDAKKLSITLSSLIKELNYNVNIKHNVYNKVNSLFKGNINIRADVVTNSLIIASCFQDFKSLCKIIEKLDRPRVQVFVEAAVIEIILNENKLYKIDLLNNFNYILSNISCYFANIIKDMIYYFIDYSYNVSACSEILQLMSKIIKFVKLDVIKDINVNNVLHMLEIDNHINILATPSIITLDNEKTKMSIGKKIPIYNMFTIDEKYKNKYDLNKNNISLYEDIKFELSIIPHVNNLDQIRFEIHQIMNDINNNSIFKYNSYPIINTQNIKTTVIANDRETVMIGGLINHKIYKEIKKIPWIGYIPLINKFFYYYDEKQEKSNVLIILTPYIIRHHMDYQKIYLKKLTYNVNSIVSLNKDKR